MKVKNLISITIMVLTLLSMVNTVGYANNNNLILSKQQQTNSLTIYTYQSLMADPYYDIAGNFSAFSGIPVSNINIQRFSDANALVTKLEQEKTHPVADVVIGIDNALEYLANMSDILTPYKSQELSNINQSLIQNLDINNYLTPYDYGMISFYYNNTIVNPTIYPVLNNLTFENLASSPLLSKIVTENPTISSTGLGFLLSTVGYYGDNESVYNLPGLTGYKYGDWVSFWSKTHSSINITDTWNDAFTVFSDPKADRPFMVSYGTSPAYDYCEYNTTTTSAAVTTYEGKQYAGYQIEGIGLVKNGPDSANGKKFIDWFLGKDVQSQIATTNWMYPANTQATIPACFTHSSLNPNHVLMLNNYVQPASLQQYLNSWLTIWEDVVVSKNVPGFTFSLFFIVSFLAIFAIREIKRKKTI